MNFSDRQHHHIHYDKQWASGIEICSISSSHHLLCQQGVSYTPKCTPHHIVSYSQQTVSDNCSFLEGEFPHIQYSE